MDIKQYIDYFDEISHLPREVQFKLLEQAGNDIHKNYKWPILTLTSYFMRLAFICLFTGGSYLFFGFSNWLLVPLVLALLCARIATTEINDSLMLTALKRNLPANVT